MRTKRAQKRRPPVPTSAKPPKGLPDPFGAVFPRLVEQEERAQEEHCDERIEYGENFAQNKWWADLTDELDRSFEYEYADELDRRYGVKYDSGPESYEEDYPTWQEYESYRRAFPWLEMS